MDPFLAAGLATGAPDFIGGLFSNSRNSREGRANRQFQERMSSTAAQRAVADYRAAGLNPALAYDRPASSPGGSMAQVENPVRGAISSGLSAAMARKDIESRRLQDDAVAAQTAKTGVEGANAILQGDILAQQKLLNQQDLDLRLALQPHHIRAAAIANIAAQHGLSKAKAESAYYNMMGAAAPAIENLAGPAAGLVGAGAGVAALLRSRGMGSGSAKSLQGMFRAPNRRPGTWETFNRKANGDRRPPGVMRNEP